MARYLSRYSAHKKTVRKGVQTLVQGTQGPSLQQMSPPYIALFQKAGVTPWEREFAKTHFGTSGLAEGESLYDRLASYDTDEEARRNHWTEEEKLAVEEALDKDAGSDYFRVEKPRLDPPWPNYDELLPAGRRTPEMVAATIAETVKTLGLDVDSVLAYELENRNRIEVLNALRVEEDELVVVA